MERQNFAIIKKSAALVKEGLEIGKKTSLTYKMRINQKAGHKRRYIAKRKVKSKEKIGIVVSEVGNKVGNAFRRSH